MVIDPHILSTLQNFEVVLRGRVWAVLDMNGWMLSDPSRDHLGFLTVQMRQ